MKTFTLPYKLLIYDIETAVLAAYLFSLGEQTVRHTQLLPYANMFKILTISYSWYHCPEIYTLTGDDAVEQFDKIARQADVIIGKNNYRFDDKRLQTERLIKKLQPYPNWVYVSDDLESQLRKYFAFPSYSLDAISEFFGFGGKKKMEFSDWVNIDKYQITQEFCKLIPNPTYFGNKFTQVLFKDSLTSIQMKGKKALQKMIVYNKKDVKDTKAILKRILPYIILKHNASVKIKERGKPVINKACILCGSTKLTPVKIITHGQTKYQEFLCREHDGYAGKATISYDQHKNKRFGAITK